MKQVKKKAGKKRNRVFSPGCSCQSPPGLRARAGLPALASAAASEIVFVVPQNGTILSLKS